MVAVFVALDTLAMALTLLVAAFFVRAWVRSGDRLYLLVGLGFALVAASYPSVAPTHFDDDERVGALEALRVVGQTGGSLVLALAYAGARGGRRVNAWRVLGWAVLATGLLLLALYAVVPPAGRLPYAQTLASAHAVQCLAYAACMALSSSGFRRVPRLDRALVPLAFLGWVFTKYTWLLIDVSGADALVPFVYAFRFAAIGLLLLALLMPVRPPEVPS